MELRRKYGVEEIATFVASSPAKPALRSAYDARGKRVLDLLIVFAVALPALLILAIFAVLIKLDGGSVFYVQQRVGRDGRSFGMWKLRSMVPQAHEKLTDYLARNPEAQWEWMTTQKLKRDPRITPIGRFIRKSSIDELPQLWNVLRGEMSIVGPRPMMCEQRTLYPGLAYYSMRPGLTGYWQISDRNDCDFAQRATFDSAYYRDLSLRTDLSVILRTFRVVLRGTGY